MEVYIELAIIDNFLINGAILFLTSYSLRLKIGFWRLFTSAFVGMSFAVALPLLKLHGVYLFLVKICLGIIMILIMNKKLKIKEYVLYYVVFLTFTFVLGGFCYFLENLFKGSGGGFYLPVSVVLIIMLFYIFFLIKAITAFYKKRQLHNFIYNIKISCNKREVAAKAYLDSGNTLCDNGKPIIIITTKIFNKFYEKKFHEILLYKDYSQLENAHFIEYSTIDKQSKMLVFKPDYLKVCETEGCYNNILLGVSLKNFSKDFDVIMGNLN